MTIKFSELILTMQQQLDATQAHQTRTLDNHLLIELVDTLRPMHIHDVDEISHNIEHFIQAILRIPNAKNIIQQYVFQLLQSYQQSQVYADLGLFSLDGFWNQFGQRAAGKFLPTIPEQHQLNYLVEQIFYEESDYEWLEKITPTQWTQLLSLFDNTQSTNHQHSQNEMIYAISILSYRISGLGLYPEFMRALPELSQRESPFLVQNQEVVDFIQQYKNFQHHDEQVSVLPPPDPAQALVILEQCRELVLKVRRATKRIGVSFSLTYLLTLLEQSLERITILLHLLCQEKPQRYTTFGHFITVLSKAHHEEKSVRALLSRNSELIALQITENASRTGEHYVSSDRQGLLDMYRRAAGGGAIIACMATIKALTGRLVLAPFAQALLYGLNYAIGFVFIHLVHFTVATKQPAATAAALAATIQQRKGSKNAQLIELTSLIVNIIRTQFWAILGNISIAIPVAGLISLAWSYGLHEPLLSHAKASKTLHDLNPFTSLAIPHAAIAGVCLFLSGLIAGYFDNLAKYRRIAPRLKAHIKMAQKFGQERLDRFADYIEKNLGAIMGNFIFGLMLGSMGTIGMILGLPLDIRHIAFASANFIQGIMNINDPNFALIFVSFLGVILIGLTNLFVSFTLTIIVALRARRVHFEQWKPLAKLVLTHFVTRPSDFFWTNHTAETTVKDDTPPTTSKVND